MWGVTGIKLHYIRLLAGLEMVLGGKAPANNLTGQQAHIYHDTDFLHPIFCNSTVCSFIHFSSLICFLSFPSIVVSLLFFSFLFFCFTPFLLLSLSLRDSDTSLFPPAFWDQAEREVERAMLSKSLVVLTETIILLMCCHCCCTL